MGALLSTSRPHRGPSLSRVARLVARFLPGVSPSRLSRISNISFEASASDEIRRLVQSIPTTFGKREFLARVDRFQQRQIGQLALAYGSEAQAKLVILKVSNLLVSRHGLFHRHTQLVGAPTVLMFDPSNTCQLQCPSCVHSSTARRAGEPSASDGREHFLWPRGRMPSSSFERMMRDFGPYAFGAVMYNYGEPLIHKAFPAMVRRVKSFGMIATTSSNLSLKFDVDGVVGSGLDSLTMSIDGTSQATLERYRKRANYDLCLANIHALVDAKRRAGRGPHLVWQFLTFAHNSHEIEGAIQLARKIGVDQINIVTPFDVSWDDPGVQVYKSELQGSYVFNPDRHLSDPIALESLSIDELGLDLALSESWVSRMERLGVEEEPSRAGKDTCDWLYQNITFDSADRIMPCCMAPTSEKQLHFADIGDAGHDVANSEPYRRARLSFADRAAFETGDAGSTAGEPFCARCRETPVVPLQPDPHFRLLLRRLDQGRVFNKKAVDALTDWASDR
jgi:hypothetical protein